MLVPKPAPTEGSIINVSPSTRPYRYYLDLGEIKIKMGLLL